MQKDLSQAEVRVAKKTLGNVLPPEVCRANPVVLEPRRLTTAAKVVIRGSIAQEKYRSIFAPSQAARRC